MATLPVQGDVPCIVLSADVCTDYPMERFLSVNLDSNRLYLMMVPNPPCHSQGDFSFKPGKAAPGTLQEGGQPGYSHGGDAVIHPELIRRATDTVFPLRTLLAIVLSESLCIGE